MRAFSFLFLISWTSKAPIPMPLPTAKDKPLFTPGPLTTSLSVKQAMLHDAGSWHWEFNAKVKAIRARILGIADLDQAGGWEAVLLQGSGTFGVESVFASCVPPTGTSAVRSNASYGERTARMLPAQRSPHAVPRTIADTPNDPAALDALLASDPAITHVAAVHCETTTGILNDIAAIGAVARKHGRTYIVDAMSSFGAYPIDFSACSIDFLISSANKCLEGVPGFSFVIGKRAAFFATEGWARSLSLDLLGQLKGFEKSGQFRYTPPTHSILAFEQALDEFDGEGGIEGRAARYRHNHATLLAGMAKIGMRPYLRPEVQSHIITSFPFPADPKFTFDAFYRLVSDKGFILYPGKISQADTFRIGNIGRLFEADMKQVVYTIGEALAEMGVRVQG